VILSKRPDIERFLSRPDPQIRAAVIYGRDMGVVHDRARQLAAKLVPNPDDPFDVSQLTDGDMDADGGRPARGRGGGGGGAGGSWGWVGGGCRR
jgi:DNA polymerase-3 subunit delta